MDIKEINLKLPPQVFNLIVGCMVKQPYEAVAPAIDLLTKQANDPAMQSHLGTPLPAIPPVTPKEDSPSAGKSSA